MVLTSGKLQVLLSRSVAIYGETLYIFSYTHVLHANTFSLENIFHFHFYRFCCISDFFLDPTRNVNYIEKQNSENNSKNQGKTQFESK